jgi:tetratricopeptide (TPR) repeat protein
MSTWKRVGGFWLVVLVLLGPAAALACLRVWPQSWAQESQDGRFEMILETVPTGPASQLPDHLLTLRDRRAGKVVWQSGLPHGVARNGVLLSPGGRYLALVDALSSEVRILGPNGTTHGRWSLQDQLTDGERRKLGLSACGAWWISSPRFEGDVLTLVVPTDVPPGLADSPSPGPVQGIRFRIDPATGRVSRDRPLPEKSTKVLIHVFRSARGRSERIQSARVLRGLSQRLPRGDNPELRRFWLELLRESETPLEWELGTEAMEGLSALGTDEDVRSLLPLLSQDREVSDHVLALLDRRFPEEAVHQAVRALEERAPRAYPLVHAVSLLRQRPGAEIDKALRHALGHPSAGVRANALYQLSQRVAPREAIELALSFLDDPETLLHYRAAYVLCDLLRRVKGPDRLVALELLRRAEDGGKLARFPEGVILLAAVADKVGDRARALALYSRGLTAMVDIPEQRGWNTYSVRLEAKLQLALEARAQGRQDEARRLAREVLEDRSGNVEVCAPAANVYLPFGRPEACVPQRTAREVAVELLTPSRPDGGP